MLVEVKNPGLSHTQRELVRCIVAKWQATGRSPSFRELMDACDISSTSVVSYHLRPLEEQGYIRWTRQQSRGIKPLAKAYDLVGETEPCPACWGTGRKKK